VNVYYGLKILILPVNQKVSLTAVSGNFFPVFFLNPVFELKDEKWLQS